MPPDGSFGTLYCARDFKTCFLETLLRDRPILAVLQADYDARSVLILLLDTSRLRLVSLHGDAAIILRLDSAELMGMDYDYTQALSKMIYDHPSKPDGIVIPVAIRLRILRRGFVRPSPPARPPVPQ